MSKDIRAYTAASNKGILLNANENPENLSGDILIEIQQELLHIPYNRYPDDGENELLEAYGKIIGFSKENLLAGNGSDQMLGLLIQTYLGKGKKMLTFDPDFSMYDYYASCYEGNVLKYSLDEYGKLDIDGFIAYGLKNGVNLVMFSNPNNPTGNCLGIDEIERIVKGFGNTPVVVDEAYFEFADETSALSLIQKYSSLYVTRTLSKAWGLAGIRTGFMISNQRNMTEMKKNKVPYALNAVSMKIAGVVLRHEEEMKASVSRIKAERKRLYEETGNMKNIHFYPSQANFLHGYCTDKKKLLELMNKNGIIIRNYPDEYTFRISIGTKAQNDAVLNVLRQYEKESV